MRLPKLPEKSPAEREDKTVRRLEDSFGWWNHVYCGAGRDGISTRFGTENNRRNIVLSLHVDGFSPYNTGTKSYTAIQCMILNLPENLRHLSKFILVVGLIPGPKAPKSVVPYLDHLVDELLVLYNEGMEVLDPTLKPPRKIMVKVKLLFTCADLPAHCDNNCQQGHAARYGCFKCFIQVSLKPAGNSNDFGPLNILGCFGSFWVIMCSFRF